MLVRHPNPVADALNEVPPDDEWYIEGDGDSVTYAYNGDFRDHEPNITRSIEIRDDGPEPWEASLAIPGLRGSLDPRLSHTADTLEAVIDWAADHHDDEF